MSILEEHVKNEEWAVLERLIENLHSAFKREFGPINKIFTYYLVDYNVWKKDLLLRKTIGGAFNEERRLALVIFPSAKESYLHNGEEGSRVWKKYFKWLEQQIKDNKKEKENAPK